MRFLGKILVVLGALTIGLVSAQAQEDPIATRKGLMQNVGAAAKASGAMVRGKAPYDAVKAELAMRSVNASLIAVAHYFPPDSKTGGKTTASPKIWSDLQGFVKLRNELVAASAAAVQAAKQGPDAFKAAFGKAAATCKKCHQAYRVKKKK